MSIALQRLIYYRYQWKVQVKCCYCLRTQSRLCTSSSLYVVKDNRKCITNNKASVDLSRTPLYTSCSLLKGLLFPKLSYSSVRSYHFPSARHLVPPQKSYSTKKNVDPIEEESKTSKEDTTGQSSSGSVDGSSASIKTPEGQPSSGSVDGSSASIKTPEGQSSSGSVDGSSASIKTPEGQPSSGSVDGSSASIKTPEGQSSSGSVDGSSASIKTPEDSLTEVSKSTIDSKIGNERLLSRIQKFFLWRFTWYLKRFQQSLENEMPDTFNMFRIFSVGLKDFVIDFMDYFKVLIIISMPGSTLRSLSRREIELYYNMPGNMLRVFPVLVLSSLPFGQNIAFPIGYWFPKQLLCYHFWDLKQRHDFAMLSLKKRLFNARPAFRSMQATLPTIGNRADQDKCRAVFYKLGSGIHPTPAEIVSLLPLFQGYPFHLKKIRMTHVNGLLRLHGNSVLLRRRGQLFDHARMIHYLDTAISREGVENLTYDQLKSSLFLRGVNPTNMSTKSMTDFMERWLTVSKEVDSTSYSLLLHLPILLAYNHPTNFVLIY